MAKQKKQKTQLRTARREAIERDGMCQKCGIPHPLSVHHILPKSLYPDKKFDVNNMITLCCNCHTILHKRVSLKDMKPGSKYLSRWLGAIETQYRK